MEQDTIICVENLSKSFDGRTVLEDVSFQVKRGQVLVIMGGSGCGKTTLLRIITGSLKPDRGKVYIAGEEMGYGDQKALDRIRRRFGVLYQSAALLNSLTVGENVALPLREHTKLDNKIINIIIKMKLELVGLTGFENLIPSQISGGMKKRVGLARAIALDPEIVFYDEPGAGLDPITAAVIDELILDLSKKLAITSVVVTHEMKSAFRVADYMIMLYKGKVIAQGVPEEIKTHPDPLAQQFINGLPDGPIPMRTSRDEYLKRLIAEE